MNSILYGLRFDTPLGACQLRASAAGLVSARFDEAACLLPANAACHEAARQIRAYFGAALYAFDVPLDAQGTAFQKAVWAALLQLPYGTTTDYGALAALLGRPHAARAVGAAIGKNPLWLIVPCHRVIGRDGSLTGYAGGLDRKRALLDLEAAHATA